MKISSVSLSKKRILNTFVFSLLFSITVIIPDYLLRYFSSNYIAHFHANTFVYIFCFMSSLFLIKNNKFFNITLALVWLLIISSLFYLFHFGRYFLGIDVPMLFIETEDIMIGFFSDLLKFWYLIFGGVVLYLFSLWFRKKTFSKVYHSNYFIIVFIAVLLYKPYYVYTTQDTKHNPSPLRYVFRNGINSLSNYITKVAFSTTAPKHFFKYKVEKQRDINEPTTIIFYIAESTSPHNMSLYGYNRKTTPQLDSLKNDKNFIYKRAISAGVSTSISLPHIFNFQQEPENFMASFEKNVNLFKLARNQGFQTVMYSPQASITFSNIGIEYVDRAIYRDNARSEYNKYGDDYAFKLLKETPIKDKNFFVVQTRAVHYPYENIYKDLPQFNKFNDKDKSFKLNTYDNAMLYLDDLLYKVIQWSKTLKGNVYVIITSDHGQMMGQDNLWGHSFLDFRVAEVPFMIYTPRAKNFNFPSILSHYDISNFIANLLGYKITNPNTSKDDIFINGNNINGSAGFLKYKRQNDKLIEVK